MNTYIYTFGYGQTDPLTGNKLDNRYVKIKGNSREETHQKMLQRFGYGNSTGNWAFDYLNEEQAGVKKYGIIEIDFETGKDK